MFVHNIYFLNTAVPADESPDRARFQFGAISSRKKKDGLVVKDSRGVYKDIKTPSSGRDRHLILSYCHDVSGVEISETFKIENEILANRIIDYLNNYFAKVTTNCSSFVGYLHTGHFTKPEEGEEYIFSYSGMNLYSGQKIKTGDSICVFYYSHFAKSRRMPKELYKHYRSNRKIRIYNNMSGVKKSFSATDLFDIYHSGFFRDYHFMYCIGEKNGEPLFITQIGRHEPDSGMRKNDTPIVVTVGMAKFYVHVPALILIKRGRGR